MGQLLHEKNMWSHLWGEIGLLLRPLFEGHALDTTTFLHRKRGCIYFKAGRDADVGIPITLPHPFFHKNSKWVGLQFIWLKQI